MKAMCQRLETDYRVMVAWSLLSYSSLLQIRSEASQPLADSSPVLSSSPSSLLYYSVFMANFTCLPEDVLKIVMQHVPPKDRLASCCLVSKRLYVAAVAATDDLRLMFGPNRTDPDVFNTSDAAGALEWIGNHGQHLTSLHFDGWPQLLQELHCPELLQLQLSYCNVQLGPTADGVPGVIQGCTKLTRLELDDSDILDTSDDAVVDSLSSLVHLQHLDVGFDSVLFERATLPCWQHLTALSQPRLSTANFQRLSGLTSLQELHLATAGDDDVGPNSSALPPSLTKLLLCPEVFVDILSVVPIGLLDLQMYCHFDCGFEEGPGLWLSYLGRLQCLTRLDVLTEDVLEWPIVGPVYSALTASSSLVHLHMDFSCPEGVWQYMFNATCKLPHLMHMRLSMSLPLWCAGDLSRLASCCPSLCDAGTLSLQSGLSVSELHKLTTLTRLGVFHDNEDTVSFEEAMRGLAALTQLRHVEVERVSQSIKVAALLPLTSLTALTAIRIHYPTTCITVVNKQVSQISTVRAIVVWLACSLLQLRLPTCMSKTST
mgnify:CR=1 FL=1